MKQKCVDCGTWSGRFHLCLKDASTEVVFAASRKTPNRVRRTPEQIEAHRSRMSEAASTRWARVREEYALKKDEAINKYRAGLGSNQIAKDLEISRTSVIKMLHEARDAGELVMRPQGGTTGPRASKYDAVREEVIRAYKDDMVSMLDIAKAHDIKPTAVNTILRRAQSEGLVTIRGKAQRYYARPEKLDATTQAKMVEEYRAGGISLRELGKQYGVGETTAHKIVNRAAE